MTSSMASVVVLVVALFAVFMVEPASASNASSTTLCNLSGRWVDGYTAAAEATQVGSTVTFKALSGQKWKQVTGVVQGNTVILRFGPVELAGELSDHCGHIRWDENTYWDSTENIETAHVVMMTHLDVGFTNYARNVCDLYFNNHFPEAIKTAEQMRQMGGTAQFAYTSHPWLVNEYLHGTAGCAHKPRTPQQVKELESAIAAGYVLWHGKPMNIFPELSDATTFDHGLALAQNLNAEFNTSWGVHLAKSTDVPGLSKSVIPLLAARGIGAVHMGYNGACLVPDLPRVFLWRHEATNTEVVAFVEQGYGYRVIPHAPGLRDALVFLYTIDNGAPPNATQVATWWNKTQVEAFPNGKMKLSSLDAFAEIVIAAKHELPVVTQEIGDSWLYGSPADPFKLAGFREIRRVRNEFVAAGTLSPSDPSLVAFDARLLKPPEHNWGLSVGQYFPQLRTATGNWSNAKFHAARTKYPQYAMLEAAWREERSFLTPLPASQQQAAEGTPTAGWQAFEAAIAERVVKLNHPAAPPATASLAPALPGTLYSCQSLSVMFSAVDGSITSLLHQQQSGAAPRQWAKPSSPLAQLRYQTFTLEDFDSFNRAYNPGCGPPCGDFSKAGMDSADPEHATWNMTLRGLWQLPVGRESASGCSFLAHVQPPVEAATKYGCSADFWVNTTLVPSSSSVDVTVAWFNKTATRLAEATWLSWPLAVEDAGEGGGEAASAWSLDVLGQRVDPLDVVLNGTRHIHAVWSGVYYNSSSSSSSSSSSGSGGSAAIQSLDAAVVGMGDIDHLLDYDGTSQPDMSGGVHFNLHNNVWGTAFPQWYDDDAVFRFTLQVGQ